MVIPEILPHVHAVAKMELCYLPDGGIVFCSSRCNRFVPRWYVQVATLYRCDGDGGNIRPLSSNIEQDNTPCVLPALKKAKETMSRRCASCHDVSGTMKLPSAPDDNLGVRLHHLKFGEGAPRFWTPPWLKPDPDLRTGSLEWMKKYAEPRMQFSHNILYNLSRPEKSLQLLALLSKAAGGLGICGDVFTETTDEDYRLLLAGIQESKFYLEQITRFNMPNFGPEPEYVLEM